MKFKTKFFPIFFISISLLLVNPVNAQKKQKVFKAYLIVNNTSEKLKKDSLFNANLKLDVKNILKKKNYVLVSNTEMEEAEKMYLYIYVVITDSLKISAKKSSGMGKVYLMPYPEKTFYYGNKTSLIKYVIRYIKKYL